MPPTAKLRWTPNNVSHIRRHDVRPTEVEEVFTGEPVEQVGHSGRSIFVGPTKNGRMLAVVVEEEEGAVYYPVTARLASRVEGRLYANARGA